MIYKRENPVGLDFIIDQIQSRLESKLSSKWNGDMEVFPRCYILENKDGYRTIEHYLGNNQYTGNLISSEGNKFFFTAEDNQERVNNIQFETKLNLFGILHLPSIYPNSKDRVDGNVLADIIKILDSCPGIQSQINIITDFQEIYQSYKYDFDNQQPYYYVRIELNTMPYAIDKNC